MADQLEYRIKVKDDGTAVVKKFGGAVQKSGKDVQGLGKASGIAGKAMKGLVAAMAIKQVIGFAKSIADTYDQQIKLGRAVGMSAKSIAGFQFAAQLGGTSAESMDKAMVKLAKNIKDADQGIGLAKDSFKAMGIELRNQDGSLRKTDDIILEIAEGFKGLKNGTEKAALSQELFGKSGAALINTLNGGSEALKRQVEEGALLSGVNEENAKLMEEFNDAMLRLKTGGTGAFASIVVSMKPWIDNLALASRLMSENISHTKLMEDLTEQDNKALLRNLKIDHEIAKLNKETMSGSERNKAGLLFLDLQRLEKSLKLSKEDSERLDRETYGIAKVIDARRKGDKDLENIEKKKLADIRALTQEAVDQVTTISKTKTKAQKKEKDNSEQQYNDAMDALEKDEAERIATIERISKIQDEDDAKEMRRFDEIMEFEANAEQSLREQEIKNEEDRLKAQQKYIESLQTGFGLAAQSASRLSNTLSNFSQAELNNISSTYAAKKAAIEKNSSEQMQAAVGNATRQQTIEANLKNSLALLEEEKLKKEAESKAKYSKTVKALKIAEATANGAVAVTQAFAQFGWPLGLIPAGIVTALVASEIGLISSQKFAGGGEPQGKNAVVTMNESGQEAVLNASAYKYIGRDFVQSLNSGRGEDVLGRSSGGGNITVNLSGIVDKRAVQNILLPAINEAIRNKR